MKEKQRLLLQTHFGDAYLAHALLDLTTNKKKATTLRVLQTQYIGNDQDAPSLSYSYVRRQVERLTSGIFERIASWIKTIDEKRLLVLDIPTELDSLLLGVNQLIRGVTAATASTVQTVWDGAKYLWAFLVQLWNPQDPVPEFLNQGQNVSSILFADLLKEYTSTYILPALRTIFYGLKNLVELVIAKIGEVVQTAGLALGYFVKEAASLTVDTVGSTLYQLKRSAVHCAFFATSSLSEVSQYVTIGFEEARQFLRSQSFALTQLIDDLLIRGERQESAFLGLFDNPIFQKIREAVGVGFDALKRILTYCWNALTRVLYALSTFLPSFCKRIVDFVGGTFANWMTQIRTLFDYLTSFQQNGAESYLVLDLEKLIAEAKSVRTKAALRADPEDMRQLISAIGNAEEWTIKLKQYSEDRYKFLLRSGPGGLKELWQSISSSATAMTSLYFDEEAEQPEEVFDDLMYSQTGRSANEFTQEYVMVLLALQSSINLVAHGRTSNTPESDKVLPTTGLRQRKPAVPFQNVEGILDCFKSREARRSEIQTMQAREKILETQIAARKNTVAYQEEARRVAIQERDAYARAGVSETEISAIRKTYEAIKDAIDVEVSQLEKEYRALKASISYKLGSFDTCQTWARGFTLLAVLGVIGGLVWMWYSRMTEKHEFEMRLMAGVKMQAIEDAAARDPFIMRFTNRIYTEKNFQQIASDHPLQVLNKFQVELLDFPSKLRNWGDAYTVEELESWGSLCLNSFHLQMRIAATESKREKEAQANSWTAKAKGVLAFFFNTAVSKKDITSSKPAIAAELMSDAAIAESWLKESSVGAVSEGVVSVAGAFGNAADLYKMKLADFELNKFANGVVQGYQGNASEYRRHLATLAEMAIAIYQQRFEVYAEKVKPQPEGYLGMVGRIMAETVIGVKDYAAGLVQATGALGPDWIAMADFDKMGYQISRGSIPFIAMQAEAALAIGAGTFYIIHGFIRIIYGVMFLIIGHIFDRHAGTYDQGMENILEGGGLLTRAMERVVALTISIFSTRATAFLAGFGLILTAARLFFPWMGILKAAGSFLQGCWNLLAKLPSLVRRSNSNQLHESFAQTSRTANSSIIASNNVARGTFAPSPSGPSGGYDIDYFN